MSTVKAKKDELIPDVGDFSQFFKNRSKLSASLSDVISNVYEWSTSLEPSDDNLPLPFVSKNEEVVWSYLKHQNKQLEGVNRKYKGFLSELIGKPHIRISAKTPQFNDDAENSEDDPEGDDMDAEDVDDEEEDLDDVDDEEEGDVDLFNLNESDLKNLDADLKKMAEEEDEEEELDVDGSKKSSGEEPKKFKKSIVDDEFFSLEEMHDFLQKTERGHGKKGSVKEQEEMMFEDEDSWDGKTDYTYEDFFGSRDAVPEAPEASANGKKASEKKRKAGEADLSLDKGKNKKRVRFAMDEQEEEREEEDPEDVDDEEFDDEEEEEGPVLLGANLQEEKEESGFEKRQNKMKERIQKLEEENLAPKSWELSGEVAADQRDQNTLLEKHVDFDHGARRAPEVTEEFTDRLEQLIRQRIKDKAWDDPVRVKKVEAKNARFETEAIENQMNQKTSLAEVYEKEFQTAAAGGQNGEKKENPAHEQIKQKMTDLFRLIDALTHFEYKPEEAREEVRVVSNMAALRVEEVGITASTEAQLMAPEEVTKKMKALEKGKEERDATDKARERRQKKAKQRSMLAEFGEEAVFGKQKAARKEKAERGKDKKGEEKVKSSNFFSKLQETVMNEKKEGGAVTKKKKIVKRMKTDKNSAAIKL